MSRNRKAQVSAGENLAWVILSFPSFHPGKTLGRRDMPVSGAPSLLRRLSARALSPTTLSVQYPRAVKTAAAAWRNLADLFRARHFFSEAEAERRALRGPGLPHHRHPMTADEALAGIILIGLISIALGYLAWVTL